MKKIIIFSLLAGCASQQFIEKNGKKTLNPMYISKKLNENTPKFTQCYKEELETGSKLSGLIKLDFKILDNGTVSNSEITSENIVSTTFLNCMIAVINEIHYPATHNGEFINITQPLNLRP